MKRLTMSAVLVATALCAQAQTRLHVKGTCPRDVEKVYVLQVKGRPTLIDSVTVRDGQFSYERETEQNAVLGFGTTRSYLPVINDGSTVEVNLIEHTAKGSELNAVLAETDKRFDEMDAQLSQQMESLSEGINDENRKARLAQARQLSEETDRMKISKLKTLTHTLAPAVFLPDLIYSMSFEDMENFLHPEAPYYDHPNMKNVKRVYEGLKKRRPGMMFTDMEIPDMDGTTHKLSEWCGKGKVVLIDFWASWCGPCRQEMPTVVESYKQYQDKGYEIIGISFDRKAEAWKAGVQQLGMTWPQLSDLKYWQSEAAGVYGISSIPSNILLDGEGKIIAIDLRGENLLNKLAEVLK